MKLKVANMVVLQLAALQFNTAVMIADQLVFLPYHLANALLIANQLAFLAYHNQVAAIMNKIAYKLLVRITTNLLINFLVHPILVLVNKLLIHILLRAIHNLIMVDNVLKVIGTMEIAYQLPILMQVAIFLTYRPVVLQLAIADLTLEVNG